MYENRQKIALIGIGTGTPDLLTSQAEKRIRESSCLIGAGRMLQCARQIPELPRKPEFEEYRADRKHTANTGTRLCSCPGIRDFSAGRKN